MIPLGKIRDDLTVGREPLPNTRRFSACAVSVPENSSLSTGTVLWAEGCVSQGPRGTHPSQGRSAGLPSARTPARLWAREPMRRGSKAQSEQAASQRQRLRCLLPDSDKSVTASQASQPSQTLCHMAWSMARSKAMTPVLTREKFFVYLVKTYWLFRAVLRALPWAPWRWCCVLATEGLDSTP